MDEEQLLVQRKNHVATLRLNRPEKKNSLSPELVEMLIDTLEELSGDDSVRVVVIRGAGDEAFCAGYDVRYLPTRHQKEVDARLKTLNLVESLFNKVINFPFPVISMINGVAYGAGCELAICCDIRIAAEEVRMGMPPAKLGLVYPWTGLQRFMQTIGIRSTREIFLTGRSYQGKRLKEIGLVDYLISGEDLKSFTYRMADEIATNAPLALKGTKRVINLLMQSKQLDENGLAEAQSITEAAFLSEDLQEGRRAFIEKRKPSFRGK
jgi:enoyl-CoA hydratase/carnithine racemase